MQFAKLLKLKTDQANLPIFKYNDMIVSAVKEHNVVLIAGDTGCGKSTQVSLKTSGALLVAVGCECVINMWHACISLLLNICIKCINSISEHTDMLDSICVVCTINISQMKVLSCLKGAYLKVRLYVQ